MFPGQALEQPVTPQASMEGKRQRKIPGRNLGREGGELQGGQTCPGLGNESGIGLFESHRVGRVTFNFRKKRPKLSLKRDTTCPMLGLFPGSPSSRNSSWFAAAATLETSDILTA